jgi:hypothetical protein
VVSGQLNVVKDLKRTNHYCQFWKKLTFDWFVDNPSQDVDDQRPQYPCNECIQDANNRFRPFSSSSVPSTKCSSLRYTSSLSPRHTYLPLYYKFPAMAQARPSNLDLQPALHQNSFLPTPTVRLRWNSHERTRWTHSSRG